MTILRSILYILLPSSLYRNDYRLIGEYQFENLDLRAEIPAMVFYSEEDPPFEEMKKWGEYFIGSIEYERFSGKHFFIQEYHKKMAEMITAKLV